MGYLHQIDTLKALAELLLIRLVHLQTGEYDGQLFIYGGVGGLVSLHCLFGLFGPGGYLVGIATMLGQYLSGLRGITKGRALVANLSNALLQILRAQPG